MEEGEGGKEEPDLYETHCYWTDCDKEFGNQDDLVKVRILLNFLIQYFADFYPRHPVIFAYLWSTIAKLSANLNLHVQKRVFCTLHT